MLGFLQAAIVIFAGAAGTYVAFSVGPLQETMRIALGLSDNQVSLLQGAAIYLPSALAAIPFGFLIDRVSRAQLLAVFVGLAILGTVLTAAAPNFYVLFLARALIGLMGGAIAMTASALVAGFVAPALRGRTLMLLGIGQIAGGSLVFALGGNLVAHYGGGPNSWRWAMLWLAAPLAVIFAATFFVRDPGRHARVALHESPRAALIELWRYRAVMLPLSFGPLVVGMGYVAATVWTAPILARKFGLPPDRAGAIMGSVLLIAGLAGPLLGGLLSDLCQRLGGPRMTMTLMIGLALLQVPTGFFGMMPSVFWVSAFLIGLSTISFMKGIICTTLSTVVIPDELRGLCFGVQNTIGAIVSGISPLLVSLLAGVIGGPAGIGIALTAVTVSTSLVGAALFAWGRPNFPGKPA